MITTETFIIEINNLKDDMLRELTELNSKRDQLLKDIGKLNTLLTLTVEDEEHGKENE